jgi:hypothetical protein
MKPLVDLVIDQTSRVFVMQQSVKRESTFYQLCLSRIHLGRTSIDQPSTEFLGTSTQTYPTSSFERAWALI